MTVDRSNQVALAKPDAAKSAIGRDQGGRLADESVGRRRRTKPCRSQAHHELSHSPLEDSKVLLATSLRILLQQIVCRRNRYQQYVSQAQLALESLPLSTVEYGLAASAVQNVRNYLSNNELGAAKYELNLLLRRLPQLLETI